MKITSTRMNFIYQMAYEVLILITPFITSPYLARVIGADGVGTYTYSYSIANFFVLFSLLGLKNYGNRAIAQTRDDKEKLNFTFSNIVVLHIIISLIFICVYVVYVLTLEEKIYAVIQLGFVFSGLLDISWFYFGIENFRLTAGRSAIIRVLNVICIFIFVKTSDDLWIYCLIMSLGYLFSQLTLWVPLRRYVKLVKPKWDNMKTHIRPMLILFIPSIAVSLYKYMDKIMLGAISSNTQLGLYENAEKVTNIPVTIISSFGTVMLPRMSNLAAKKDKKESARYTAISMQFVMCLALALTFGIAAVGQVFAPVFWGDEFTLSGSLIMGLAATIPFISFANVIRTQYLIPNHEDRQFVISVIAGAIINLIINSFLISRYGAWGATIGTIAAEVAVCLIQMFMVRKKLPLFSYIKSFAFFILVGVLMFAGVYAYGVIFGATIPTLIIQIVIGTIFYGVIAVIYFVKTKNTTAINTINSVLKRIKISYRIK